MDRYIRIVRELLRSEDVGVQWRLDYVVGVQWRLDYVIRTALDRR